MVVTFVIVVRGDNSNMYCERAIKESAVNGLWFGRSQAHGSINKYQAFYQYNSWNKRELHIK